MSCDLIFFFFLNILGRFYIFGTFKNGINEQQNETKGVAIHQSNLFIYENIHQF